MRYTEAALNTGLDEFEAWREKAVHSNSDTSEAESELLATLRTRIEGVINPITPIKPEESDALVFLAAAGREMYNYQKDSFLKIFKTLPPKEKGDLIVIYKGITEEDPKQLRLARLIPELERLLNAEIEENKT